MSPDPKDIRATILAQFLAYGWKELSAPAVAEKEFETAAGIRTAIAWLPADGKIKAGFLSAEYWSEGRNILSARSLTLPIMNAPHGLPEIAVATRKKIEEFENTINESYARALYLKHPDPAATPPENDKTASCSSRPRARL